MRTQMQTYNTKHFALFDPEMSLSDSPMDFLNRLESYVENGMEVIGMVGNKVLFKKVIVPVVNSGTI